MALALAWKLKLDIDAPERINKHKFKPNQTIQNSNSKNNSYKAEYRPSELLCPETLAWVRLEASARAALDASPYVKLSRLPGAAIAPNLAFGGGDAGGGGGADAATDGALAAAEAARRARDAAAADAAPQPVLLPGVRAPLRWRAAVGAGLLGPPAAAAAPAARLEANIKRWRALVGPVAASAVYAVGSGVEGSGGSDEEEDAEEEDSGGGSGGEDGFEED